LSNNVKPARHPAPAADEPERLRLSVKVRTGSEFDEKSGTIKRNTVQLFKVAGTFHVPQQQEKQHVSRLGGRHMECACYLLNCIANKRLTQAEWLKRQAQLWKEFGGPCDVRTRDQVSDAEMQQLRTPPK